MFFLENLEAQFNEALTKHRNGDVDTADIVYRKVLSINPGHTEARHMLAVVHLQKGHIKEAEENVRIALKNNGEEAKYSNTLGSILIEQGRLPEALIAFETALSKDTNFTAAAYNIGTVLLSLNKPRNAENVFRKILKTEVNEAPIYCNLASALIKQGKIGEAVKCCRDGLAIHQNNPELGTTLASALELSNNLEAAEEEARKVHEVFPDHALTLLILARILRRKKAVNRAYNTLKPIFQTSLSNSDEAEANYEMGLIQDVRKRYAEAFRHFSKCNDILRRSPGALLCDGDQYLDKVRDYSRWKKGPSFKNSASIVSAPNLVFFVGFPRSGTTLVEQILKSHPNLITTEENSPLPFVETEARKRAADHGLMYPECLDEWGAEVFDELRRLFLTKAAELVGSFADSVLVDKLPLNIVSLGLVEKLWPDALVLAALRDPRDVCLSCFIQRFVNNNAMINFLDLERTGTLYAEVMDLWLQYREVLTLPYLEYRYEDLVDNFDGTIRLILEFIGVGWHDNISNYRDSAKRREIRTPSYREVTAPVHNKAVQRWKNYQEELNCISPRLNAFVRAFGYSL